MSDVPFDRRTRGPEDASAVTPADLAARMPSLLADRGDLASAAFRSTGLPAFTVAVGDDVRTWRLDAGDVLEVVDGDDAAGPRADLSPEWFSDLVTDQRSAVALMVAGLPVMARGGIEHLIRWEKALRALVDGRPAWTAGAVDFVDREGRPLDLGRSFRPDDDPLERAHFLEQAGYLVVRGVFTSGEVAALDHEMTSWFSRMTPDDDRSWYARADGSDQCVRVTNLDAREIEFPFADRLGPLVADVAPGHAYRTSDLLRKPVGTTEGISDLPWHRDCELGMHAYRCANISCGTSVTASGPDNGQLGVVAGSHRVNVSMLDVDRVDLPKVYLATEPGDVTVHLSCVLHCATPPERDERRVTYSTFRLPGDTAELDRKIKAVRDQAGRETYAPR